MTDIYESRPYTYLIGWKSLDTWYYGVRYAKAANPNELCVKYFTSSKYVKAFIQLHGLPDVVEIRKTFSDKKSAMLWENKVLRRLKVVESRRWLNQTYNMGPDFKVSKRNTIPGMLAAKAKMTGKTWEELFGIEKASQMRKRCQESGRAVWRDPALVARMKVRNNTENYKKAALKRWSNPEERAQRLESLKYARSCKTK